jgi:lysozyme family protein
VTTEQLIAGIIDREGETFTDDSADRGGPTRYGITQAVLSEFRGQPVSAGQVAALTRDEAAEIYEHLYVMKSHFLHLLDERVRVMLIDWAVTSGLSAATKGLQRVLGVEVDGLCGPVTIGTANKVDGTWLLKSLGLARQTFYVRCAKADAGQLRFLEGWLNRNWAVSVDPL